MALTAGRAALVGFLCSVAATVTFWSGPLASATSALHSSGHTTDVVLHTSTGSDHHTR